MQHGFTLLPPDDCRCRGPDLVALSFFASAIDHDDGGTMRPVQATPAFSPHDVEFEKCLGGYDSGGGGAQLDWACG